jgi:hypothetical protein
MYDMDHKDRVAGSTGKNILVYPWPSAAGSLLKAYYIPIVADLGLTDSPVFDDEEWQMAIVYDVAFRSKEKRGKMTLANYYRAQRDSIISDMKAFYDKQFTEKRKQIPRAGNDRASGINNAVVIVSP